MSLYNVDNAGPGGTGFQGVGEGSVAAAIKELQGFNVTLLAGAAAGTKIDLAAIRTEDTIVMALHNTAGTLVDETANMAIEDVRASGTLTCVSAVEDDTVTVDGVEFTLKDAPDGTYEQIDVGASDTIMATNIKDAINSYFGRPGVDKTVIATSALGVVTVRAVSEVPAVGNAITTTTTGGTITAGAATLEDGTVTGGVSCSNDLSSDQIVLFWYNKQ